MKDLHPLFQPAEQPLTAEEEEALIKRLAAAYSQDHPASTDPALQRIARKVQEHLQSQGQSPALPTPVSGEGSPEPPA